MRIEPGADMQVLVVDDEDDMRALVRATLELANGDMAVDDADSGAAAIAKVKSDRPDVIVIDHRMPGFSGLETARRILTEHPDQRVVLFTAFADRQLVAEAAAIGVRACLSKNDLRRLPDVIAGLAAGA